MQQVDMTNREVALDGAFNVRDAGGLPLGGGETIRRGLVYRSADLSRLSPAGAEQLRALGIRLVIDLRTARELEIRGRFPFEDHGMTYRHRPLMRQSSTEVTPPAEIPPDVLHRLYRAIATEGAPNVAQVVSWLGDEDALPVVVHCVAGKDRTGMIMAVLLGLLGVADEDIAADYALSEAGLAAYLAHAAQNDADLAEWLGKVPPQLMEARAEVMLDLLAWLRAEHGSVEGYARSIGVAEETIAALRERLTATA
jgi:protein tyrosine/serine phosphatase